MWQCPQSSSRLQCEPLSGQEHYVLNLISVTNRLASSAVKGSAGNYGIDGELS